MVLSDMTDHKEKKSKKDKKKKKSKTDKPSKMSATDGFGLNSSSLLMQPSKLSS